MKSLMMLWKRLAIECASWCNTSATRDCKTVSGRCEHEGLSFLTITLPSFGKDFEKSLEQGKVSPDLFLSFKKQAGLPRFLGGFLDCVFDRSSGELLDSPSIVAIKAIRQLTLMFGKIALPCSDTREREAMRRYVECEQEVKENDSRLASSDMEDFKRVSSLLFREIFTEVDREIYNGNVLPKHGPGSTADGLRGNAKYRLRTWTDRLEKIFPAGDFLLPNWSFLDQYFDINHLEPGSEIPVKVISVPKTLKTPRIIAMEPTAMQYAQQGILEVLLGEMERKHLPSGKVNPISSLIGFKDQGPNQAMALDGSLLGELATLDLSEASDRVSNQHVREMTRPWPHLHEALDATRSRKADVPGHGVIRLAKYASMGSALCFPVEAMVFLTLIFLGIEKASNSPLTKKVIYDHIGKVRVYGDDLVVPVDCVEHVIRVLQAHGSVVNTGKSFWNGKFRESCGKEYYNGSDVSIVRCRRMFPTKRAHATELISLVSLRNQLFWAGYHDTVEWLDSRVRRVISHFPLVSPESPVLGRHTHGPLRPERYDKSLQRPLVRGYVVTSKSPVDRLDDSGALLKFFLKRGNSPFFDEDHLERAGRPQAVYIKLRWSSPF